MWPGHLVNLGDQDTRPLHYSRPVVVVVVIIIVVVLLQWNRAVCSMALSTHVCPGHGHLVNLGDPPYALSHPPHTTSFSHSRRMEVTQHHSHTSSLGECTLTLYALSWEELPLKRGGSPPKQLSCSSYTIWVDTITLCSNTIIIIIIMILLPSPFRQFWSPWVLTQRTC